MNGTRQIERRGSLTLIVLVCLTVCSSILGARIHAAIQYRRHLNAQHTADQLDWILRSAVDRALGELRTTDRETDRSDEGKSWTLPEWELADPPGRLTAAVVTFQITETDETKQRIHVNVMGTLPPDTTVRKSHSFDVLLSNTSRKPNPLAEP